MMCLECGSIFEQPKLHEENTENWTASAIELYSTYYCCPTCGSDMIEDVEE